MVKKILSLHPIHDPQHWLGRAEEARTLADDMSDEASREAMRRIARDYERLADRARRRLDEMSKGR